MSLMRNHRTFLFSATQLFQSNASLRPVVSNSSIALHTLSLDPSFSDFFHSSILFNFSPILFFYNRGHFISKVQFFTRNFFRNFTRRRSSKASGTMKWALIEINLIELAQWDQKDSQILK